MRDFGMEAVVDLLATLASLVGAVGFTVAGLLVDRSGLDLLLAGSTTMGAWELLMGTLAVFVGLYLLGYRTAWPALFGRR